MADRENSPEHEHAIVIDEKHGFRRLDPIPSSGELDRFYQSEYYHLLKAGGRAPDIRRLLSEKGAADAERRWLEHTLYADVRDYVLALAPGKRVLEVGCGAGRLLSWLQEEAGFEVEGIEPAEEAVAIARERGLPVFCGDLAGWMEQRGEDDRGFDAIVFINVLEHLPDPEAVLAQAHRALEPGGLLCIRVPNDFSAIQREARAQTGNREWWVAVPDHIHYFDFDSLESLVGASGFKPVGRHADFPMELFLLMGDDYVADPGRGSECHRRRVEFEMSISRDLRRRMSGALAQIGVGRNAMVLAKRDGGEKPPRVDMRALDKRAGDYRYTGLRHRDIEPLRHFRNAQMAVLRQKAPLTAAAQENWYRRTVLPTHNDPEPDFLLVSILDGEGKFIGYGGLTYIDWDHRRAEVSFLVDPERVEDRALYREDFLNFLEFLKAWSFDELGLNRIFTETFAFREYHMSVLEEAGFRAEGRLVQHVIDPFDESRFVDCIMHGVCAGGATE